MLTNSPVHTCDAERRTEYKAASASERSLSIDRCAPACGHRQERSGDKAGRLRGRSADDLNQADRRRRARLNRILCVEDDKETASLLEEALSELGYAVESAPDGEQGLAAIIADLPDLIISDVRIPRMSGFELLERVTAAGPALAEIPFVFLTAFGDRGSELTGRRLGADDYLTKPVDFEMLGIVVENRLRRRHDRFGAQPEFRLTDREREVLTWVARGKTSSEIAIILGLRERTVNFFCDQAMKRLDATNRTQAVAKAVTHYLITI
jgi:DNA-binding NarL/FixJ family response regulator